MAGNHTLGTIRGSIEIDYDGAGIVKAQRDVDNFKNSGDKMSGASNKVLGSFTSFAKGATIVGGAVSSLNSTIGLVAGTLATVGPIAAAAFVAAPAAILSYQAALGIAKIALSGVSEGLAAAGESSEKFEKAIEKLSPEAQKFAKAFRQAYPALTNVKNAIQDAFFKGAAGQVGGVVQKIASLAGPASAISGNMGKLAQEVVKFATSSRSMENIKTILGQVNAFLARIRGSVGPVVQEFIALAARTGAFGDTLGGTVANALDRFTKFLARVNPSEIFGEAMPILRALGSVFSDLGVIVKEIFGIFVTDGAQVTGVLADMVGTLADFLQSAQGQEALTALGTAMAEIGGAAGAVFLALLKALAPAITALAPGLGVLATQIASALVPAINALNPLLTALAGFLGQNMGWLGPVAGAVVAAAAAYKVYAASVAAVAAVQTALTSQLALSAAAWVQNTAAMVATRVAAIATSVAVGVQMAAAWAISTAAIIANRIAIVASIAAQAAIRAATIAWTAVQWALNAALLANPIGLVIIAIAAFVAAIVLAYQNSETFRRIVDAAWKGIQSAIKAVVNWITGTAWPAIKSAWNAIASGTTSLWNSIKSIWNSIKSAITTALNAIRNTAKTVWAAIVSAIRTAINTVKSVITSGFNAAKATVNSVLNSIRNVVRTIWNGIVSVVRSAINSVKSAIRGINAIVATVRNAFNNAKNAAKTAINSLISAVKGIKSRAASALSGLGSLLVSKGRALIQGFINGIKQMAGKAASAARSVVSAVTDFLPGSPAKKGPLSGKGYVLYRAQRFMADFSRGIKSKEKTVRRAVTPTVRMMPSVVPGSSKRATDIARLERIRDTIKGGGTATAPVNDNYVEESGNNVYEISIGSKPFATLVVDAVTGAPVEVAKAANEGNRKIKWSGSGRVVAF